MAQADTTRSTAQVQSGATQAGVLPASGPVLLGTFTKDRAAHALIRDGRGRIETVTIGDTVGRQQVVAIEPGTLVLMRHGRAERLEIPGS